MSEQYKIHEGDVLETLKTLPDNYFDAMVSDPPYGISFCGAAWDHGVPSAEVFEEIKRVLKPAAWVLAFGGTRKWHRLACSIEDAGLEIKDTICWTYGCLSEDTEILTEDGWVVYNEFRKSKSYTEERILIYDVQKDIYTWERPARWYEYSIEQDTVYRIRSNNTDQIVSRGHRCLVEREGKLVFIQADELYDVEYMPVLLPDIS
jgi:DNA modification methylase